MTGTTKLIKEAKQLQRKLFKGEITLKEFDDAMALLKKEIFCQAGDALRRAGVKMEAGQ
jgi:hypothetical protein